MNKKEKDLMDEMSLMLDVFNSCIVTKTLPKIASPCNVKILELLRKSGRKPTAIIKQKI
ncbi:MAG: hypothetical protein KAT04_14465 [Methylococcales bacterium]|nr:hypothetical protein [Methylococcales bacterium]